MNPIRPGVPALYPSVPVGARQPQPYGAQTEHSHPDTLSLARLSDNTRLALNQFEAQPNENGHHHFLALLVSNGLAEGALRMLSSRGTEVCYQQKVDTPSVTGAQGEREESTLTVRTAFNEYAQYDITDIHFDGPSSGATASINLSYPIPAVTIGLEPILPSGDQQSASGHVAAQYSQSQLTQSLLYLTHPLDFSGYALPSSASNSTQQLVFSHGSSATGAPGQEKMFAPYPASSLRSAFSTSSVGRRAASARVPDPKNPGQTIAESTLRGRQQVPDPDNPQETISRSARIQRKQVPDPKNPGRTISLSTLNNRKYRMKRKEQNPTIRNG